MVKSRVVRFLSVCVLMSVMVVFLGNAPVTAMTTKIRLGNWVPFHHLIVQGILIPWTKAIEKESGGTLKFEIMKSALGRPNTYYDLVAGGTLDAGWGVIGTTHQHAQLSYPESGRSGRKKDTRGGQCYRQDSQNAWRHARAAPTYRDPASHGPRHLRRDHFSSGIDRVL